MKWYPCTVSNIKHFIFECNIISYISAASAGLSKSMNIQPAGTTLAKFGPSYFSTTS